MIKKYSNEKAYDFYYAYQKSLELGFVQDTDKSYTDKFCRSLYTLIKMVRAEKYDSWNRHGTEHYHYWLSYDKSQSKFVYTVPDRKKDDDWAVELMDNALEMFSKKEVDDWADFVFSKEYKENVEIIADYYFNTGNFFQNIVRKVKNGDYLPKHQYQRFIANKYASKILAAHKAEPLFEKGALVDFRTSHAETGDKHGISKIFKTAPNGLLILSSEEPIVSPCKGGKRYKVVCIGDTKPFWTEERYLKKRKQKRSNKK